MKILHGVTLVLSCMLATGAGAQSFSILPAPEDATFGFGTPGRTRVQIILSTPLAAPPDPGVMENVRRTLYGQAQRECATLTNEFKADCRLSSLTLEALAPFPNGPPPQRPFALNAVAVYELRPK
jgi:hypothetical protein